MAHLAVRAAAPLLAGCASLALLVAPVPGTAQTSCSSMDPSEWPAPAKPYFLVIADTSASMAAAAAANRCGFTPSDLGGQVRCALSRVVPAFAGQVEIGLATFAMRMAACSGACFAGCSYSALPGDGGGTGCGSGSGATRAGAYLRVPVRQDAFWTALPAPDPSALLGWFDGACGAEGELFAYGSRPLNGALRDARRYLETGWYDPVAAATIASPLAAQDRACRSLNVVLIAAGDESCDSQADAVAAATALYATGVTAGSNSYRVKVHVVNYVSGTQASMDAIASEGGTATAHFAANETDLAAALASILGSAVRAEVCDNDDDDCNGCVDEGSHHYANAGQTCCSWSTSGQRAACLSAYQASVASAPPRGDLALLPCTTLAQSQSPSTWLCYDPGDACDGQDNNGRNGTDEGQLKCGWPAHCPTTEGCNGLDDDCDGSVDEGGVCVACVPSPEVCNGCDDDCNGVADDVDPFPVPCGLAGAGIPPACAGTRSCKAPVNVPIGGCSATGGWGTCSATPAAETCNGVDDDCDGVVDENVGDCVPQGTSGGLVYGGTSRCRRGTMACGGTCTGFVGPAAEICNGLDDDCDGTVDEGASDGVHAVGDACCAYGGRCGRGVCTQGAYACAGDRLACSGGTGPQAETCNALDDDCDGIVDDVVGAGASCVAEGGAPGHVSCDTNAGALACVAW